MSPRHLHLFPGPAYTLCSPPHRYTEREKNGGEKNDETDGGNKKREERRKLKVIEGESKGKKKIQKVFVRACVCVCGNVGGVCANMCVRSWTKTRRGQ